MNLKSFGFLALMLCTAAVSAVTPAKATFNVQNMTCAACGLTIQTALRRVPGVGSTQVDARKNTVTVEFDSERTSPKALATVITNAGFPAAQSRSGG